MAKKKLIVVSFDAMIREDLDNTQFQPGLDWMMREGARVDHMRSLYPSLTYPCHVSMASGCYPDKHGVTLNEHRLPGVKNPPWLHMHDAVRVEDILDACKKAGMVTASVGWPVSGNHPSADYLIDEMWPKDTGDAAAFRRAYEETGTAPALYDAVVAPHIWQRLGRRHPDSSYFYTDCACDIIRLYKPDLLMLHVANMDHYRHGEGVMNERLRMAAYECDRMIQSLIFATRQAGVYDQTNFVVTSDHGQMNIVRYVKPNLLLKRHGFMSTDAAGNVTDWRAWCCSAGMSAQITLKDPQDKQLHEEVYALLCRARDEGVWGISEVYTNEETRALEHLDGDFSFVIESDDYSSFSRDWREPYAVNCPLDTFGRKAGSHGFYPDKGPKSPFICCGPAFRKGAVLDSARLVDGAPTYARVLGVELPQADGRVLEELLAE